jgi:hypothetical protein
MWKNYLQIKKKFGQKFKFRFWSIEPLYFEFGAEILVVGSWNNNSSILSSGL